MASYVNSTGKRLGSEAQTYAVQAAGVFSRSKDSKSLMKVAVTGKTASRDKAFALWLETGIVEEVDTAESPKEQEGGTFSMVRISENYGSVVPDPSTTVGNIKVASFFRNNQDGKLYRKVSVTGHIPAAGNSWVLEMGKAALVELSDSQAIVNLGGAASHEWNLA